MKINRKLIAAFAVLSVAFSACTEADVNYGEDATAAAPVAVTYDDMGSSATSLAVYWDAAPAVNAGATSFTVQLLKSVDETPDPYNSANSVVIMTSSNFVGSASVAEGDAVCDQAVFSNLVKGKSYYVRVRSNYVNSRFSPWVFCSDASGNPVKIKLGKGIVPADEPDDKTAPTVKMVDQFITASDAIVTWSTYNWGNNDNDFAMGYTLTLNKGSELIVKWYFEENCSIWNKYARHGIRWIFTALEPETEYTVLVENTTDGVSAEPIKFTTKKSQVVTVPSTPAAAGDIILYEDFGELHITGDLASGAANYSYEKRNEMPEQWIARGDNPLLAEDGRGCYLVDPSTEVGLFNTLSNYVLVTRLKDWGWTAEDNKSGAICARAGYVKMGASSKCAWIATPELNCLAQPAKVELSFDAALYETDPRTAIIEVFNGATMGSKNLLTVTDRITAANFEVGAVAGEWARYTYTIDNVMPGARIAIGADRAGVDGQHRFYLDNIQVKVLSYGQLTLDAPANVALTATDKTISATWDAVANAKGYVVEYKAKSAADWTALEAVAETAATIEGLTFETEYEVRVKAVADEVSSDYSAVATIKTLAEIKKLATPAVEAVAGLGWAWVKVTPVLNATGYDVYVGDKKVESVVSKTTDEFVMVRVDGLELNTPFAFKVKAVAEGIESSDFSAEVTGVTGNIVQNTVNVGPTHISVKWDDVSGGTSGSARAYYVELAKDKAMTDLVYAQYCRDGQAAAGGAFGGSSWYGKAAGTNLLPPTAVTFGTLQPATTYYFRVKTVADYVEECAKGTVKLNATNGASEFSPVVAFTTEAAHVAASNEVLYQGFDECGIQSDFMNVAAGVTPYISDKASVTYPHTGDWCIYPFANSHLFTTWGYATKSVAYVDGSTTHKVGFDGAGEHANCVVGDKLPSLTGWHFGSEVSPHQGFVKVGTSSKIGFYVGTPALTSPLLAAAGTPCTVSFRACPLMRDARNVVIEVYRAATKTFEVVKTVELDAQVAAGNTADDYVFTPKWTNVSLDITLAPGDNVAFASAGKNRFALDDILIVVK